MQFHTIKIFVKMLAFCTVCELGKPPQNPPHLATTENDRSYIDPIEMLHYLSEFQLNFPHHITPMLYQNSNNSSAQLYRNPHESESLPSSFDAQISQSTYNPSFQERPFDVGNFHEANQQQQVAASADYDSATASVTNGKNISNSIK